MNVTLQARNFAETIKLLRTLPCQYHAGLSRWTPGSLRERGGERERHRDRDTERKCYSADFGNGGGHKPRDTSGFQKLEKGRGSPREPKVERSPAFSMTGYQETHFRLLTSRSESSPSSGHPCHPRLPPGVRQLLSESASLPPGAERSAVGSEEALPCSKESHSSCSLKLPGDVSATKM